MAVPNYTYLKLNMPSPKGVITIEVSFKQAYSAIKTTLPKRSH